MDTTRDMNCDKSDERPVSPSLVHTFWIGGDLPAWTFACVQSYLDTGHTVFWWLYFEERANDFAALRKMEQLQKGKLRLKAAGAILPFSTAQKFYYHGMGEDGSWSGWAPLSDWFRYELIKRFGGWWVDADGVSVRNLSTLVDKDPVPIICTERHRLDRRKIGAVAVSLPQFSATEIDSSIRKPPCGSASFHNWVGKVKRAGLDVCLTTNSHFFMPTRGSAIMTKLADQMYRLLQRYANEVETRGIASVRELRKNGEARCALPTGTVGMTRFQNIVREQLSRGDIRILHWSVFNPVEANEAARMYRVLVGQDLLVGSWIKTIHIFRKVREDWGPLGLEMPLEFHPRIAALEIAHNKRLRRKSPGHCIQVQARTVASSAEAPMMDPKKQKKKKKKKNTNPKAKAKSRPCKDLYASFTRSDGKERNTDVADDEEPLRKKAKNKSVAGNASQQVAMCTRCGLHPQNTRERVAKGLCCNNCPHHGPWCSGRQAKNMLHQLLESQVNSDNDGK